MLRLYAENLAVVPLVNLWRPLAVTVGITFAIWTIATLALRDLRRGAIVASTLTALLFVAAPLEAFLGPWPTFGLYLLAAILAGWKWKRSPTFFFNVTGLVLAAMVAFQIGYRLNRAYQALSEIHVAKAERGGTKATQTPDIFYIILDAYGRSDAIKHYIGYDNSEFVDGLRKRGFYIADKGHSNYSQTEQSLSSSLNMDFLSNLLPPGTINEVARLEFDRLIDRNRVSSILRTQGYRYVAVTTGFDSVNPRSADVRYEGVSQFTLFETTLLNATPFAQSGVIAGSQFEMRYARLLGAFDNLTRIAPRGALPRFVFVHILAPHPPFVLNADGSRRPKGRGPYGLWDGDAFFRVGGTVHEYKAGYFGQAEYVGKRMLGVVDAILKAQSPAPIIIVQGDHGSKVKLDDQSLERTDVREVFRNLNAFYVPDSVRTELYPEITPVNSFRIILSKLFGQSLPKLPDKSYYSTWDQPAEFADVTDKIERPFSN